ncbi:cyclase family protein [Aliikangiella marina]|uniref:Cyclase family protein n=1 Tax=Aliikangiella marina TaxID=1712262 RepID=A0A545T9D1_9GAMM|nr:cyclase family protein [Aliikangiella marina]TQV73823.1 cyclase family protein [Aliikangiella marina]
MIIKLDIAKKTYEADLSQPQSIAIALLPNGDQPSHFGAPACTSKTLEGDGFIGDTKRGGSCNVNTLTIVPHCNGTHTESVSHIVDQHVAVFNAIDESLFASVLVTLQPLEARDVIDQYIPEYDPSNLVITRAQLEKYLAEYSNEQLSGLVIRTLPNTSDKCFQRYDKNHYPIYLTNDAMSYIVEREVKHLLVDFPSVDKMYDQGKLSNHRLFWQVELNQTSLNTHSTCNKTISEMVFVDNQILDGFYLCNLQVPKIDTDAVPSHPVLYSLNEI